MYIFYIIISNSFCLIIINMTYAYKILYSKENVLNLIISIKKCSENIFFKSV